jgi:RND superfamily putative drug exporter
MEARNLAARAGRWSAAHRKTAIFGWLAFVIVAVFLGGALGTKNLSDSDTDIGSSGRADAATRAAFPDGVGESVLVQSRSKTVDDAQFKAAIADVKKRIAAQQGVRDVGKTVDISKDKHSALVNFTINGDDDVAEKHVDATLAATAAAQKAHPSLRIEEFGGASADKALSKSIEDDFSRAEKLSLPLTLAILIVAFGALVAAGIPLLLALSAVAAAIGLTGVVSHVFPVDESISSVILLIGLAVGVDYTMFYLRREREERAKGRSPREALEIAAATSGRAVLVSGLTVMIAMAGLFMSGFAVFTSFAVGTILVVAIAMIGSVTVLPALLAALGDKVEKGRIPFIGRHKKSGED